MSSKLLNFLKRILLSEFGIDDDRDLAIMSYTANSDGYYVNYQTWHDPNWTSSSITIYNSQLIAYSKILRSTSVEFSISNTQNW